MNLSSCVTMCGNYQHSVTLGVFNLAINPFCGVRVKFKKKKIKGRLH